jgi:hypothetical protein
MKKLLFSAFALALSFMAYAQPVSDNATIPVSVTVNSILRLNITSGGNIEFVFNTLDQMSGGIDGSTRTTTTFTVASSRNFNVTLEPEGALVGTDGGTLALNNIGIAITGTTGTAAPGSNTALAATQTIVTTGLPGDAQANIYTIEWSCANGGTGMTTGVYNINPDRYSTNCYLTVVGL